MFTVVAINGTVVKSKAVSNVHVYVNAMIWSSEQSLEEIESSTI